METNDQSQPVMAFRASGQFKGARRVHIPSLLLLIAGLALASAAMVVYSQSEPDAAPKEKVPPVGMAWSWEQTFPHWPNQKPEFVIIFSGQMHGYLQKCGCSDPQKGGLERRFNFIEGFKAHGVEAIPLDLGDIGPQLAENPRLSHGQALLKYQTAMLAMKAMGYRNVAVGLEEFNLGLHEVLSAFALQNGNERPGMLGTNIKGWKAGGSVLSKKDAFPSADAKSSAIGDWNLIPTKSKLNVGVVGVISKTVIAEVKKVDDKMVFDANSGKAVSDALTAMSQQKTPPAINVLLYSGPEQLAADAALLFPQFQIVVCKTQRLDMDPVTKKAHLDPTTKLERVIDESEPPARPTMIKNTMLIEVGHKGQNIGVVGVFRDKNGGLSLQYQLVTMTPAFETPVGKEAANAALSELQHYAKLVKDRGYLTMNRKGPHSLQLNNPKAEYVGSQQCAACHDAITKGDAWAAYSKSKHANAYAALVGATKPSLRQFDGECIRCHTVGYDFNTGFVDAVKTPQLMNVGCESCHGPASQHVAMPNNKQLARELSPWKATPGFVMPTVEKLKALVEEKDEAKKNLILTAVENKSMLRVHDLCFQCHNVENDPHFKFETYWPKIAHSLTLPANGNQAKKGPNVPAKGNRPPMALPKDAGPTSGPDLTQPK